MFNNEIKTPCGKTMKHMLYKYHKKKCDTCKDNGYSLNTEYIISSIHNKKGKAFLNMTCKDFKGGGFRNGRMRHITDDLIESRKYANQKKKEKKDKLI